MAEENWEVVDEVGGSLQAEILRGLLEAQEIPVWLSQEGAGREGYSTGVGLLGRVQILVPTSQMEHAREVLKAYYAGEFEGLEFEPRAAQQIEDEVMDELEDDLDGDEEVE